MSIIQQRDQDYLRDFFSQNLERDVTIALYTESGAGLIVPGRQPCETCADTQQLLEELVELSDHLQLDVHDFYAEREQAASLGVEQIPAILLHGNNQGTVRFIGVPSGYEFTTLVRDLVDVSRGTTELEYHSREALGRLREPVHIKVFVTPT